MSKTIIMELTTQSINSAINEVKNYQKELDKKCKQFISSMLQNGMYVTQMTVNQIPSSEKGNITVSVQQSASSGLYEGYICMNGSQCAFIEFGAGVLKNTQAGGSLHTRGTKLGFTIDSYNPNGKANISDWKGSNATNPKGWFKPGGAYTKGIPTYAPLEKSFVQIKSNFAKIAKAVF